MHRVFVQASRDTCHSKGLVELDDVVSLSVTFKDKEISPFFVFHYIFKMGSRDTYSKGLVELSMTTSSVCR